jgi:hypothetical protein
MRTTTGRGGRRADAVVLAALGVLASLLSAGPAAASECVTLRSAKLGVRYEFRYTDGQGTVLTSTTEYLAVSDTSVRLRLTHGGPAGTTDTTETVSESTQRVVDDLLVIDRTESTGVSARGRFRNTTTYHPPMTGDPASRVCPGRTWTIPPVRVSTATSLGGSSEVTTDPGTGRVISVRAPVTVPAGTFETVHYEKTFTGPHGPVVQEFWRSIAHGITVKYVHRAGGTVATQELLGPPP